MALARQRVHRLAAGGIGMNRLLSCGGQLPQPDGQGALRGDRVVAQAGAAQLPACPHFIHTALLQALLQGLQGWLASVPAPACEGQAEQGRKTP